MSAPDPPDADRLRAALARLGEEEGWPEADSERLFTALHGDTSVEDRREVVEELIRNPRAAAAWRLARELEPAVQPSLRSALRQWAWLPIAATLVLLVGAAWQFAPWRSETPVYRSADPRTIAPAGPGGTLSRADPVLRWTAIEGARYRVRVLTPSLEPLAEALVDAPEYRLPPDVVRNVAPDGSILWQVEAQVRGASSIVSPTFRYAGEIADRNPPTGRHVMKGGKPTSTSSTAIEEMELLMWRQRLETSRAGSRAALICAVLVLLAASPTAGQEFLTEWRMDTPLMSFFATSERSVALTVTELGTGRVTSSVRFVAYGPDEQVLARHEDFLQRGHPATFTLRLDPSMPRKLRFRITIVGQTVGNTQPAVVVEDVDGLNFTIDQRISCSLLARYQPTARVRSRRTVLPWSSTRSPSAGRTIMLGAPAGAAFALLCATAVVPATIAAQPATPSPFDSCTPPSGEPWTQDRLLCIYRTGMRTGTLPEARLRLERLGAGNTAQPWATIALGYAVQEQDERRAVALYEIAAGGFAQARDAEGEVLARHNLRNIYQRRGDTAAAAQQVAQAIKVAEASGQPMPMARAAVLEASHEIQTGGDVGRAYRTLQRGYRFAFPSGPIGLRRSILLNLANASLYLGRLEEATDALEQHRALRKEDGSTVDAGTVAFNLLNAHLTQGEQRPTTTARERFDQGGCGCPRRGAATAASGAGCADASRARRPDAHLGSGDGRRAPRAMPGARETARPSRIACHLSLDIVAPRCRPRSAARGPDGP